MKEILQNSKLILFDLDGTVYCGKNLIGNAKQTLEKIRSSGFIVGFLTNNSSCTTKEYTKKLKKLGIFNENDIVYSSLDCAVDYLTFYRKNKSVYPLATKRVTKYLIKKGIKVRENAEILLLTFDKSINYKKITKANELLYKEVEYISTHPDDVCPTEKVPLPDAGSFIRMFKQSSKRVPDVILGKPYDYMASFIIKKLGLKPNQVTMVGDRLYTDIQFAKNCQLNSVLVLSGETDLDMLKISSVVPDVVLEDINKIVDYL